MYQFRIGFENKFEKVSKWSKWYNFNVSRILPPEILSINPNNIFPGKQNSRITLKGKNLYSSTKIELNNKNSQIEIINLKYIDSQTISFDIRTSQVQHGKYDLVVKNPGSLISRKNNYFSIRLNPGSWKLNQIAGIESGYFLPYIGIDSGYTGAIGGSLFYENHSLPKYIPRLLFLKKVPNLFLGVKLSYYQFILPESDFGSSYMIQGTVYGGYDFFMSFVRILPLCISPYIGYKHYYRRHTFQGEIYSAYRPVFAAGAQLSIFVQKTYTLGFSFEYNLFFDLEPAHTFGIFMRCGYGF